MTSAQPRRGEVYYANLDPVVGSEQAGRRPVLVIQNDVSNLYSPVTIVASITSSVSAVSRPTDFPLPPDSAGLPKASRVLLNQLRTRDRRRLERFLGQLWEEAMGQVDEALKISLGLVPL